MRTRVNGFWPGLKRVAIIALVTAFAVGCGQNNTSGTGDNPWDNNGGYNWGNGWGNTSTPTGSHGRYTVSQPVGNTGGYGSYVGVTSEGDVAVIQNGTLTMYICPRADYANGQGQITQQPIVNVTNGCVVNEITAMDIQIPGRNGIYMLGFRPIYFNNNNACYQTGGDPVRNILQQTQCLGTNSYYQQYPY